MNLGQAKKRAIQLINEYSTNGSLTPSQRNADYTLRLYAYANDAQAEISEKVGIEASFLINQTGESESGFNKHPLPDDFKRVVKVNRNDHIFNSYRIENRQLLISKHLDGEFEVFYYRNPQEITDSTPDNYTFEIDQEYHHLIPYYMGGMAVLDENQMISDKLLNLYYSKLSNAKKGTEDFPTVIQSVYHI